MTVLRTPRLEWILVAALVAAAAAAPVAFAAGEALTAHDVARLRSVTQVAVSPDGRQVAYVLSVPRSLPDQEDGPAWAELHVVGATGESRPYVVGEHNVSAIAWTPDGKSISFLAKREGDEHN
jgi:dipeptidyl aminopeptidase/acylaminoacyl peptidase